MKKESTTKNLRKFQLIKNLMGGMWTVDWFDNFNTHGTYTEIDFRLDLEKMGVTELEALKRYMDENLEAELFYEHIWNGEEIVYRDLTPAS